MTSAERLAQTTSARPSRARLITVLIGACWLVLASPVPALHGTAALLVLALVTLDILLGIETGWLALLPTSRLDERQAAVRDHTYRIAFRLVAIGVLLMILLTFVGMVAQAGPDTAFARIPGGLWPRTLVAFIELLVGGPLVVIAWLQPRDTDAGERRPARWLPLLAVPGLAVVWLAAMLWAPIQTQTKVSLPDNGLSMSNATCGHVSALKTAAAGFAGAARLEAAVCWNGQQAFTYGDPSLPVPSSMPKEEFARPDPYLTFCAPLPTDGDFATVSERCTAQIDADGTLRLTLLARLTPLPGSIGARDLDLHLVVSRYGKLIKFG